MWMGKKGSEEIKNIQEYNVVNSTSSLLIIRKELNYLKNHLRFRSISNHLNSFFLSHIA